MPNNKILGILGGLGPMATVYFYELITAHTLVEKDQDHIDMLISSKATTPDRTSYIMGKSKENPFDIMKSEAKKLVQCGAEIIAIPCNTAHYFYEEVSHCVAVPVINMVNATVERAKLLGCEKLGILATDGTINTNTYQNACKALELNCQIPSPVHQQNIMDIIYNDIKAGKPANMDKFNAAANELFNGGCSLIVLGCTELSLIKKAGLANNGYIDSMDVLAEKAITLCGKTYIDF